jgi:hypothetical protein
VALASNLRAETLEEEGEEPTTDVVVGDSFWRAAAEYYDGEGAAGGEPYYAPPKHRGLLYFADRLCQRGLPTPCICDFGDFQTKVNETAGDGGIFGNKIRLCSGTSKCVRRLCAKDRWIFVRMSI